jgi:hypothetical protein
MKRITIGVRLRLRLQVTKFNANRNVRICVTQMVNQADDNTPLK